MIDVEKFPWMIWTCPKCGDKILERTRMGMNEGKRCCLCLGGHFTGRESYSVVEMEFQGTIPEGCLWINQEMRV